jgi:DNA-binding CsgD family transcriptional regulator
VGDQLTLSFVFNNLGVIASRRQEWHESIRLHEEGLAIRRRIGDPVLVAIAVFNIGEAWHQLGDFSLAKKHYTEALPTFRQVGDRRSIAFTLKNLGELARDEGNAEEAIQLLREALGLFKEIGDQGSFADSLIAIAEAPDPARFGREAVAVIAAAETAMRSHGIPAHLETPRHSRRLQDFRAKIGSPVFDKAFAEGRNWSIERAYDVTLTFSAAPHQPAPDKATSANLPFHVTSREIDVLRLLATGISSQEIADHLEISPRTVATHINNMLGKAGVTTRAALVAMALRSRIA